MEFIDLIQTVGIGGLLVVLIAVTVFNKGKAEIQESLTETKVQDIVNRTAEKSLETQDKYIKVLENQSDLMINQVRLDNVIANMKDDIKTRDDKILQLEEFRKQDSEKIKQLQRDYDDALRRVNDANAKLVTMQEQLDQERKENTAKIAALQKLIDEIRAERDEALKDRDAKDQALSEALTKIDKLEGRISELEHKGDTGELPQSA